MAVKVPVAELAATVIEALTGNKVLLDCSATAVPPAGAWPESVTVQVVAAPEASEVGLHTNEVTVSTGAVRLMEAVRELPFSEAVMVAD